MKIFFAGVPGGNQQDREENLEDDGIRRRLITFFYKNKGLITLRHFAGVEIADYKGERDYGSQTLF